MESRIGRCGRCWPNRPKIQPKIGVNCLLLGEEGMFEGWLLVREQEGFVSFYRRVPVHVVDSFGIYLWVVNTCYGSEENRECC